LPFGVSGTRTALARLVDRDGLTGLFGGSEGNSARPSGGGAG